MGKRDPSDQRRKLLGHYFRLVAETAPAFFVMENVRGLLERAGRGELDEGLNWVKDRYEITDPQIWDASDFGAATKRRRIFVIGVHKDRGAMVKASHIEALKLPAATVQQAISDLVAAEYLNDDQYGYDTWKAGKLDHSNEYLAPLRSDDGLLTGNRTTKHTANVEERFARVLPGRTDLVGRHHRLTWGGQCPTLRAGTGSDKGSYQSVRPIHPSDNRVITVREAARLQGFPDEHRFHPTVWHSFRMIGNSVAPHMAEAILRGVKSALGDRKGLTTG